MSRYSTISVPEEVKAALEKRKGDKDWGQYLLELYEAAEEEKRRRAFEKMRDMLTEEDYENMRRSSEEFRERFKLR
jgi:c-di-GMP-related signal transduction protein